MMTLSIHKIAKVQTAKDNILKFALKIAAVDGWNGDILSKASIAAGNHPSLGHLLFLGKVTNVIDYFLLQIDRDMLIRYHSLPNHNAGITQSILTCCKIRLELLNEHKAAVSRLVSFFTLPWNSAYGAKMLWRTVDDIWYEAGKDQSVDFNFYTKRGLLFFALSSTMLFWLSDFSNDNKDTIDFLESELKGIVNTARRMKGFLK